MQDIHLIRNAVEGLNNGGELFEVLPTKEDCSFCYLENGETVWRVRLNGTVLPMEFQSKGAADAGLEVERRRELKHRLDCGSKEV